MADLDQDYGRRICHLDLEVSNLTISSINQNPLWIMIEKGVVALVRRDHTNQLFPCLLGIAAWGISSTKTKELVNFFTGLFARRY